jgi:hypothetical protein
MATKRNKKVLQLPPEIKKPKPQLPDIFSHRVSIAELRRIWDSKNGRYTDDELYRIREWLYMVADVVVDVIENTDPEALQAISKRTRKKPVNECLLFFTQDKSKAA